ncbi:helix-hairpin-helix domain-containing protein, partial [Streptomyces drozdowiczii]
MTAQPRGDSPGPSPDAPVTTTDEPRPVGTGAGAVAGDGAVTDDAPEGPAVADDAPDGSGAEEGGPGDAEVGDEAPDAAAGAGGQGGAEGAPVLSEAEAELAAQRELLERIEKRKAEKDGPIDAGAKLSGTAADLLAAVRAVESGQKPATAFYDSPAPTPARRTTPAPEPVQRRAPEPAPAPRAAPPEAVEAVAAVLSAGGAPAALAGPAASLLGERAGEILREDPWQLLALPGVGPDQADGFARALLGAAAGPDDERRTAALTGWLLEQAALRGHTALDAGQVRTALGGRGVTDPAAAVQHAVAEGVVLVFQDNPEESGEAREEAQEEPEGSGAPAAPVEVLLGLDRYALAEESLADGLARLVNGGDKDADWSQAASAAPSPSAAELIRAAAAHGLVAHTGGEAARAEPAALIAAARGLGLRALGAAHSVDG